MTVLPIAGRAETWSALGRRVAAMPVLTAAALASSLLAAASGLVGPWTVGLLVDSVSAGDGTERIAVLGTVLAASVAAGAALTALGSALVGRLGQRVLARMREDAVANALDLPSAVLEESGHGDLLTRIGDDVAVVSQAVVSLLAPWVGAALTVSLTVAGLASLDPWLALAGLCAVPVYAVSLRWYLPRSAPRYAAERVAFAERAELIVASLTGLPTVHAYRVEERQAELVEGASARARAISRDVLWFFTGWSKWLNIAELVGLGCVIATGFALVSSGAVTAGAVTAAALYFHRLFNPLGLIATSFDEVQSAGASLSRIVGIARSPERRPVPTGGADAGPRTGEVEVSGLTHRYGDAVVLRDVSFRVRDGERVALVGASGAGKSTLAAVIAGLLRPSSGSVAVGGVDAAAAREAGSRAVALVSQEAHVFTGPLHADLRLARPEATRAELVDALARVGAAEWVGELPDGLDTAVGESAHALTREQTAQLALARAVLADPLVMVLDEATAEAGSQDAARLEAASAAALDGRTGVLVAHRLSQAVTADRVLVLEHGEIVEQGTPDELLALDGRFARMWKAWRG
ncbi:ABC transporter ATP-binding protein [Actinorugispora endophytica]|uniref:ATP-binding cassette subfamily C protein n=1 Tax=Actinorugispora endophytica TaxID=1605990 RepID=A0A4R6V6W1_9ACTN|nr:ABC transporter ATP-binding protein [Actinorugispora endophytica]TDQ54247.1 ATP-binding cassette subfamily C protein [Actinorugispora endophytica]